MTSGKPALAPVLTWSGVTARRMARHALTAPATGLGPAGCPAFVPPAATPRCARSSPATLYAYGPATPQHFAKWLSIPPGYAAGLFTRLAGELERVDCDGAPGWTVAGDIAAPRRTGGSACCPTSTPTWSRASPRTGCSRARPLHKLTPVQRRQLGDEVDLVSTVMEATATLTVGTVRAGAHA